MKLFRILMMSCAVPSLAAAQQVMDGSDKGLEEVPGILVKGLVPQVADPYSAQIIGIRKSMRNPDDVCGYVNVKNQNGGYTGFQPFLISGGNVLIKGVSSCQ